MPAPDWFKNLVNPFEDPKIGCVAGQILNQEVATQFGQYLKVKGHLSQDSTLHHGFLPYAQTGNVAFRREVFDRVGVFDEALWSGHDADLCWRMQLETSLGIVFAPSAAVYHAQDLSLRAFLRQKRRHANGAVLLYKKYRRFRGQETCSLKKTYWEYRSIATRSFRYVARTLVARFGLASHPPSDQGYQLLMEIGEKIGRIEGSIRNRIWYP
jgi:GT2 family glycosyltransferase